MKAPSKLSPKYAGRVGGLKGGKARAEKLSPEERAAIAKKAAEARWSKVQNKVGFKALAQHLVFQRFTRLYIE
jgi:hypothetical protein